MCLHKWKLLCTWANRNEYQCPKCLKTKGVDKNHKPPQVMIGYQHNDSPLLFNELFYRHEFCDRDKISAKWVIRLKFMR